MNYNDIKHFIINIIIINIIVFRQADYEETLKDAAEKRKASDDAGKFPG